VLELPDGVLMLNMRNYERAEPTRQTCISADGGATWREQKHDPALLDPICQASLRRLSWATASAPGIIAFANPASTKKRENLTLRISTDDAATWAAATVVHAGSAAYSSLAVVGTDRLGCLYEADNYTHIFFTAGTLAEFGIVLAQPAQPAH
jgi:sialidase-1